MPKAEAVPQPVFRDFSAEGFDEIAKRRFHANPAKTFAPNAVARCARLGFGRSPMWAAVIESGAGARRLEELRVAGCRFEGTGQGGVGVASLCLGRHGEIRRWYLDNAAKGLLPAPELPKARALAWEGFIGAVAEEELLILQEKMTVAPDGDAGAKDVGFLPARSQASSAWIEQEWSRWTARREADAQALAAMAGLPEPVQLAGLVLEDRPRTMLALAPLAAKSATPASLAKLWGLLAQSWREGGAVSEKPDPGSPPPVAWALWEKCGAALGPFMAADLDKASLPGTLSSLAFAIGLGAFKEPGKEPLGSYVGGLSRRRMDFFAMDSNSASAEGEAGAPLRSRARECLDRLEAMGCSFLGDRGPFLSVKDMAGADPASFDAEALWVAKWQPQDPKSSLALVMEDVLRRVEREELALALALGTPGQASPSAAAPRL